MTGRLQMQNPNWHKSGVLKVTEARSRAGGGTEAHKKDVSNATARRLSSISSIAWRLTRDRPTTWRRRRADRKAEEPRMGTRRETKLLNCRRARGCVGLAAGQSPPSRARHVVPREPINNHNRLESADRSPAIRTLNFSLWSLISDHPRGRAIFTPYFDLKFATFVVLLFDPFYWYFCKFLSVQFMSFWASKNTSLNKNKENSVLHICKFYLCLLLETYIKSIDPYLTLNKKCKQIIAKNAKFQFSKFANLTFVYVWEIMSNRLTSIWPWT